MRGVQFSFPSAALVLLVALASLFWIGISARALESGENAPEPEEVQEETVDPLLSAERELTSGVIEPLVAPTISLHEFPDHQYIEVVDSCGISYEGDCVLARAGPSEEYKIINRLREGVVLKVSGRVEDSPYDWYEVVFEESLRYPERVERKQYVAATPSVRHFYSNGVLDRSDIARATDKRILVDRSEQMLYAYEGDVLFMSTPISTGIQLTPTPRGNFTIYKKTPTRYMQGPIPGISTKYYDLPGVPWNLYFTNEGGVIHGAYWHKSFGRPYSNGCVNLALDDARKLYEWTEVGTKVHVRD